MDTLRETEKPMTLMIEPVKPPDRGAFHLELNLATDISVSAEAARKSVIAFVGREIADLLHGDRLDLVWGHRASTGACRSSSPRDHSAASASSARSTSTWRAAS